MEKDVEKIWLCGIHDPAKSYGMLMHSGTEEHVRMTYDAMMRGAKSSGLNSHCLKILSPDEWQEAAAKKGLGEPDVVLNLLINNSIGFDRLF